MQIQQVGGLLSLSRSDSPHRGVEPNVPPP